MEEDEIAELIDKQLKKLLSARPKKVKHVSTTSIISKEILTSPSDLCQDSAGRPKSSDSKLLHTLENMTGMDSTQPPTSSQQGSGSPQLPFRQGAQQMFYLAVPVPYILAGGCLPQSSDSTNVSGTAVPPTIEQNFHPLVTELKSQQYGINTSPGTGEF